MEKKSTATLFVGPCTIVQDQMVPTATTASPQSIIDLFYAFVHTPKTCIADVSYVYITLDQVKEFKQSIYQIIDADPTLPLEQIVKDHSQATRRIWHYDEVITATNGVGVIFNYIISLLDLADIDVEKPFLIRYHTLNFEAGSMGHLLQLFFRLMSRIGDMAFTATDNGFIETVIRQKLRSECDVLHILFSMGASPNVLIPVTSGCMADRESVLHQKIHWGCSPDILSLLLMYGASVYYQHGKYIAHEIGCALSDYLNPEILNIIFKHDWKQIFHKSHRFGWTPLIHHIRRFVISPGMFIFLFTYITKSKSKAVRGLLTQADKFGTTPLMHLAMYAEQERWWHTQDPEYVGFNAGFKMLLEQLDLTSINQRNTFGFTALICLWWNGRSFMNRGTSDSIYYNTSRNFCEQGMVNAITILLAKGAEVTDADLGVIRQLCVADQWNFKPKMKISEQSEMWMEFAKGSSPRFNAYHTLKKMIAAQVKDHLG